MDTEIQDQTWRVYKKEWKNLIKKYMWVDWIIDMIKAYLLIFFYQWDPSTATPMEEGCGLQREIEYVEK